MFFNAKQDLDYALAFTELYKSEPDPSLREAKCLAMQVPYVLTPIGEGRADCRMYETWLRRLFAAVRRKAIPTTTGMTAWRRLWMRFGIQ